jgi:hypothetical protein
MIGPCRLDALAGRDKLCPEDGCPFWEPGGAVLEGRCAFERLDLAGRPAVASELLRIREVLDAAPSGRAEDASQRRYYELLDELLSEPNEE